MVVNGRTTRPNGHWHLQPHLLRGPWRHEAAAIGQIHTIVVGEQPAELQQHGSWQVHRIPLVEQEVRVCRQRVSCETNLAAGKDSWQCLPQIASA